MPQRVLLLAVVALALGAAPCAAATLHPDINYDIDSPPAQANLNQLDLYTPDGVGADDRRPVVVYVHGGAWSIGDKANQIQDKADLFTGAGYVFASINYRLSPRTGNPETNPGRIKFPDHPHDVGEAIGWLSRHVATYGGDPDRIALIGHSAGAHLVSLVSTDPEYVNAYGVKEWQLIGTVSLDSDAYDIPHRIATGGPRRGRSSTTPSPHEPDAVSNAWVLSSPITWAGPKDPPFLLVPQAAVPDRVSESQRMAAALAAGSGGSVLPMPYDHEGINDAVGGSTDTAGETAAIMDFFSRAIAAGRGGELRGIRRAVARLARTALVSSSASRRTSPGATFKCRLGKGKLKRASRAASSASARAGIRSATRRSRAGTARARSRVSSSGSAKRPGFEHDPSPRAARPAGSCRGRGSLGRAAEVGPLVAGRPTFSVRRVAMSLKASSCSRSPISAVRSAGRGSRIAASRTFSSEPCLRSSSTAVFSPTPLAPGMPSEGSPRSAIRSGTSLGGIP